jgi:ABC-2 type transport system permease protein
MPNVLLRIIVREWRRILVEKRVVALLIGGPCFYALLFGGVYWQGRTMHVPIAIVDQDHSALSRDIASALGSSESLAVVEWADAPGDFLPLLRQEKAYACVVFPAHFERDLLAGRGPRVEAILDGSNVLIAGNALSGIRGVLATYQVATDSRELAVSGVAQTATKALARPIEPVMRPLFNPTSNYSHFMLMCLVCIAVQSVTRMACGVALGLDDREQFERDSGRTIPGTLWLFFGKVIASATLVFLAGGTALVLTFALFGAPIRGSILSISVAMALFAIIQVCIAYGYYSLFRNTLICLQFHIFSAVVFAVMAGYTWPSLAMPSVLRWASEAIPISHMITIVRRTALMGASSMQLWGHFLWLAVWMLISLAWGYWAVHRRFSEN